MIRDIILKTLTNIEIENIDIDKLIQYFNLLKEKNKTVNLISRNSKDEDIIYKHFLSSFKFIKAIESINLKNDNLNIMDIGTGGGFPGIILAIYFKNYNLYLLDSIKKKIDFLDYIKLNLNLNNVFTICNRAENLLNDLKDKKEKFDITTSRAVGNIETTLNYAIPLTKKNGFFITIKSINQLNEVQEDNKKIFLKFKNLKINIIFLDDDILIIYKNN